MGIDELQKSSTGSRAWSRRSSRAWSATIGGASERMAGSWDTLQGQQSLKSRAGLRDRARHHGLRDQRCAQGHGRRRGRRHERLVEGQRVLHPAEPAGLHQSIEESVRGFVGTVRYAASEVGGTAMADGLIGRSPVRQLGPRRDRGRLLHPGPEDQGTGSAAGIQASEKGLIEPHRRNTAAAVLDLMKESAERTPTTSSSNTRPTSSAPSPRSPERLPLVLDRGSHRGRGGAAHQRPVRGRARPRLHRRPGLLRLRPQPGEHRPPTRPRESADRQRAADAKMKSDKALAVQRSSPRTTRKRSRESTPSSARSSTSSSRSSRSTSPTSRSWPTGIAAEMRKIDDQGVRRRRHLDRGLPLDRRAHGRVRELRRRGAAGHAYAANSEARQAYGESVEDQRRGHAGGRPARQPGALVEDLRRERRGRRPRQRDLQGLDGRHEPERRRRDGQDGDRHRHLQGRLRLPWSSRSSPA